MQTEQKKALIVGTLVALVCSVLVSATVVVLKPIQDASNANERVKLIIAASGIKDASPGVFSEFEPVMVNLKDGTYTGAADPKGWFDNYHNMIKEPSTSRMLNKSEDLAAIKMVPDEMMAYIYYKNGKPDVVILPVYGTGLYSVMHAFVGIDPKTLTIVGVKFFEHGETPGLGGEVDNPRWQAKWVGKHIYSSDMNVKFTFSKYPMNLGAAGYDNTVDGISGATLTTNGVRNMMKFWFGEDGYKPFIERMNREAR